MVGDRADNDIAPARAVGMWTILFQMPHEAKGHVPAGEMERLYYESQLRESICRIPPSGPEQTPDEMGRRPRRAPRGDRADSPARRRPFRRLPHPRR